MILAIRTDKPEAELYVLNSAGDTLAEHVWHAHRQLSKEILVKIETLLGESDAIKGDLEGIIVFQGPGSFTGLRIGISVANALADGLDIAIQAATGDDWLQTGFKALSEDPQKTIVLPEYGGEANITQPRK